MTILTQEFLCHTNGMGRDSEKFTALETSSAKPTGLGGGGGSDMSLSIIIQSKMTLTNSISQYYLIKQK